MPKILTKGKGGRPVNPLWGHFNQSEDANGKLVVKCKSCNQVVSAKADRMGKHISQTCPKLKKNIYSQTCTYSQASTSSRMDPNVLAISDEDDPHSRTADGSVSDKSSTIVQPSIKRHQLSVSNFLVHTSASQKQELDIKVAKFFYACNIPFLTVENKNFIDMVNALRPGYKLPSRKNLAEDLLDKVTEELQESARKNVVGKNVTLMQDGWSNIHNDPIIVNSIQCNGKNVFISSVDSGTNKKTSEYCKNLACEAKIAAETKYGCIVKSFVSDNEQKMATMRQNLQKEDVIPIVYGCASHYLNLLGKDITTDSLMAYVIKVQKYFRNSHIPGSLLKEYADSVKPQIPGETRWNSQMTCVQTFITNRPFYLQIVDKHEDEIQDSIKHIINNHGMYKEVKNMYNQLKPVADALNRLQNDNASIADACDIFIDLLNNEELKPHSGKVKSRFDNAITPIHFLANMMNPFYKGKKLSQAQEESARKYLQDINPQYLQYTIRFQSEDEPFPKTFFSSDIINSISPSLWWKNFKKSGIDTNFLELMEHLQECPASSASLERIFSNFSFIHYKIRNRLGLQIASKLVFCYMMLKSKVETETSDW